MRHFSYFVTLAALVFSQTNARRIIRSSSFVCPVEDIIETQCLGPKDCLYPNPEDCRTFIQCTVNPGETTGTPVVMPCPAGLEWNDNEKVCDWPEFSTCQQTTITTESVETTTIIAEEITPEATTTEAITTEEPTTTEAPTTTEEPTTTNGPTTVTEVIVICTNEPGFVCPVKDIIETKCLGPKDCLYPNPEDCGTFIQCTVDPGETTGTPVVMPCPAGLKWNDNKKECDWPVNSTCDSN